MADHRPGPTLSVCTRCRASDAGEADQERAGYRLAQAIWDRFPASMAARAGVRLRGVRCMSQCKRPCAIALSDDAKFTLLFGDLDPDRDGDAVLELARMYADSPDGLVPRADRPEPLRAGILGRIPPLGVESALIDPAFTRGPSVDADSPPRRLARPSAPRDKPAEQLVVEGLTRRVDGAGGPVDLVTDVSFVIAPAEVVAIVGPNGAGKTTLIQMIAGLARPSAGAARLGGHALSEMSFAERARRIAYVGQSEEPDGRLMVADYVRLGRMPHAAGFARNAGADPVARALDPVGLAALAARRMDRLSGGERQKAKIARALCQDPSLLVLDEPTNHLDPRARGDLLAAVARMGVSVVVALHDLTLVDAFADKVAVLDNGRLIAFGAPQDALSRAQARRVFDVDLHRFDHPDADRTVAALDLAIADAVARPSAENPNP